MELQRRKPGRVHLRLRLAIRSAAVERLTASRRALEILDNRVVVYAAQSGRKFFRVTQSLQ